MFKQCKYFHSRDCAICTNIKEREVFKSILETSHPETYICAHAIYRVTNSKGSKFILPSLECISREIRGYFVNDVYTSEPIRLTKNNFEVICSKEECDVTDPYVAKYNH